MNDCKETIARHPCFQNMKPEHLEILAKSTKEIEFEPEQIVFSEGEPANGLYLIQSGRIALEAHETTAETVLVQDIGPGGVLGWSWLFAPFVWHFRARAVEPTQAIVLNGAHLLIAAERNHEFGYELMKRVAQVAIQRLQATRKVLMPDKVEAAGSVK